MASAHPPRHDDQTDPFLPEFTWEEVEDALDHLTMDDEKRFVLPTLIQELRNARHPTVTGLLLSIFTLAVVTASDQPFGVPRPGISEAHVT